MPDYTLMMQYNNGRVFLTGGHPEITNSEISRKIYKNVVKWCSKSEYYLYENTTPYSIPGILINLPAKNEYKSLFWL